MRSCLKVVASSRATSRQKQEGTLDLYNHLSRKCTIMTPLLYNGCKYGLLRGKASRK